jgi:hypothetical protein
MPWNLPYPLLMVYDPVNVKVTKQVLWLTEKLLVPPGWWIVNAPSENTARSLLLLG